MEERATLDYNPAGQITNRVSANDAYAWGNARNTDRSYVTNGLNQYQSAGAATFDYDGRGNLIRSSDPVNGATTFGYTSENRLATIPGKVMAYDPLGRFHWIGSGTTWMQYDGADLIEERNASGVIKRYVFGPGTDEPLVSYEGAGTNARRYLHADERGSVIALSDDTGAVVQRNTYDEFGIPGSNNAGRFGYTGQAWIAEAGLWSYKARMYSPTLGRFLQTDPIGYGDGLNWYNYVGSDPVNFTDPTGLQEDDVVVTGRRLRNDWGFSGFPSWFAPTSDALNSGSGGGGGGDIVVTGKPQNDDIVVNGRRHKYVMPYLSPCPASAVFGYFKQAGHSAPGAPATREGLTPRIVLTGGNPIAQYVNSSTGTIVNTTLRGHRYFPGTVTIQVTPLSAQTSTIVITGEGTGAHAEENMILGQTWFGAQAAGAQNVCGR